jgi:(heptosyl)LPS beta-1,4-glucosyltransferase
MQVRTALTAVLIVRDEAARLPACLQSLHGAVDAIVVLDTGSTDETCALLARLAADPARTPPLRWARRPFDDFSRSRAAAMALVNTPYWLWIDADERLSPALRWELAELRRSGRLEDHPLWLVPCLNRVRGRVMRSRSLAGRELARVAGIGAVRVTGDPVHEGLVPIAGRTTRGRLSAPLVHETLGAIGPYLRKIDLYTTLEARAGRSRYGLLQPLHLLVTGPATFWREWVSRGGWRDGGPGLLWAALSAWSAVLRSWKALSRGAQRRSAAD